MNCRDRSYIKQRIILLIISVISAGAFISGLYIQKYYQLIPCPLCILQRYAFFLVGILAFIGAMTTSKKNIIIFTVLSALNSLIGFGIASWQTYIQSFPSHFQCSTGLSSIVNNSKLAQWFPDIFSGYGECSIISWKLGILTLPMIGMITFGFLIVLLVTSRVILK